MKKALDLNIDLAKKNLFPILKKQYIDNIPTWENFYHIFRSAHEKKDINFQSFMSLTISNSEQYYDLFDPIIENLKKIHRGNIIGVMSIVNFIDDENNNHYKNVFSEEFFRLNPNKMPNDHLIKTEIKPTKHFDLADGFFIQCEGITSWNFYINNIKKSFIAEPGDLIFIPSGLYHDVHPKTSRCSISISFN